MKITLISFDNWGFNKHIANTLTEKGHTVTPIDFHTFKFSYDSFFHRIKNFFLKNFLKQNVKTKFYGQQIIKELEKNNEQQDLILTIKGDFIAPEYAIQLKNYTKKSTAFFNDNSKRCPKIIGVLDCFDDVYSFEKEDCEKYNLKFKSNFIYNFKEKKKDNNPVEFEIFNISSIGKRTSLIVKIAEQLNLKSIKHKFIIHDKKKKLKPNPLLTLINSPISLEEVATYIEKSNTLLDIHRDNQSGLSFRVFECMGLHKKLITTNFNVKEYDFYNENNILVIEANNPVIDADFFEKPYEEIPTEILEKYKLSGWVNEFI
ncbi:hypothetical protein [Flavobacterium sp.]|uniref:hypothetical protein n=1 Tax=Flavobacterium sp. TaxID=239 RepID=UPI003F69EA3D